MQLGSNPFHCKFPSNIMKLDRTNNLYIFHNPVISGNAPYNIGKMNGLIDIGLSLTYLHGKIPFKFGMIKELSYLGMDETCIHGPIPADLEKV